MSSVKNRRELYSEATRTAILDEATALFAERGFAHTSLEEIAAAGLLSRGAIYHHFAGKKALFEAVLDRLQADVRGRITVAAVQFSDPWDAAIAALDVFLDESCSPIYGKLVWQEGPLALGWEHWREFEQGSYALVEGLIIALMDAGYLERKAESTTVRICYEMLHAACVVLAEASEDDKMRVRGECADLLHRLLNGLRPSEQRWSAEPDSPKSRSASARRPARKR
ncbi:TetR family transcriptional regulator [Mycobacterium colombiense]|uniref:TetR family transcriptional regulator n=1 Tax=Mycobacterium colombiense TaxID=339268 RepID=A0A1A0VE02_9MYCO|nr:TetR/AcrR family transcriptional regulator [Mycobacterium colombiense]OBB81487.1 TetR family transcriptional regulator [Mycobacterium colombiense]